jgi:hypothetical protein
MCRYMGTCSEAGPLPKQEEEKKHAGVMENWCLSGHGRIIHPDLPD